MEKWYVAKSIHRKKKVLKTHLEQLGVELYDPFIPGSYPNSIVPLAPGYLFCRIDANEPIWYRHLPGLHYFLGSEEGLIPVDDDKMDELQRRVYVWNNQLQEGDLISVIGGPFSGFGGRFLAYKNSEERSRIVLEKLGYDVGVEINTAALAFTGNFKRAGLYNGNKRPRRTRGKGRIIRHGDRPFEE